MTIRVGVFGAGGRIGALVCRAVASDPELQLVATVDPHHAGIDLRQLVKIESPVLQVAATADEFVRQGVQVAIDFTVVDAARQNVAFLAEHGIHAVVGTTGFDDDDYEQLKERFVHSNCLIAPNFAIGSVLMTRFAALAAPLFETASIVEIVSEVARDDHPDAPSPAARAIAERMARARGETSPGPQLHSMRLRGLPGRLEVLLGTTGQWLSMSYHTSHDSMFVPGVLLATKRISRQALRLTVGLDELLWPTVS